MRIPLPRQSAAEAWLPDEWVIEEELRRERDRHNGERPYLELPLPAPEIYSEPPVEEEPQRGVLIIDL